MARMVSAKCRAPPSARSSRSTEVITTCASPSFARRLRDMHRARCGSSAPGSPVLTLQKAQARVQVSPRIMKVACFFSQHSPILGQPASSQTVCRPFSRTMALGRRIAPGDRRLDADPVGLAQHGASGRCAFSGWRGLPAVWSRTTVIPSHTYEARAAPATGSAIPRLSASDWRGQAGPPCQVVHHTSGRFRLDCTHESAALPPASILARFLLCLPFFIMLLLMLIEASLHAATTYLVIKVGRDVAKGTFLVWPTWCGSWRRNRPPISSAR